MNEHEMFVQTYGMLVFQPLLFELVKGMPNKIQPSCCIHVSFDLPGISHLLLVQLAALCAV